MDRPQQPRELVYCHQCENEWYRDEHGIVCPECQSDFTEIIEANRDPRDDDRPQLGAGNDFFAPDPDEGNIDDLHWTPNGPGQPAGGQFRGTFTRNMGAGGQDAGGQPGLLGGLFGTALQGLLGGPQQQRGQTRQGTPGAEGESNRSAPGSPQQGQHELHRGNNGTFIRHGHGPGFSYTITTSSGGNLYPRDANQPQPFQGQPDHIENIMRQMFLNIGAMPGAGFGGGGGMHAHGPDGPIFMGVGGPGMRGNAGPMPLNDIFSLFGMPRGGVHGDAVYTQEALDRIITQLMEQHQAGNAPGPASAEAIESLPKRKITEKDAGDSGTADCSICMDEAKVGDEVTELPCSHWFHHDCIRAWLAEHDTCPHCRQGIMPKDEPNTNRPRQPDQQPLHDMHSPEYQQQQVPGGYPFPRTNSSGGDGSRQTNAGSSGGMFSRMREAFSPGGRSRGSGQDGNNRGGSGSSGMNDGR